MNLHRALVLEEASTMDVGLTPTKKFFKAVVVITAPLSKEDAELLECGYLYDGAGNPHTFDGAHKLHGELSGAQIELQGKTKGLQLKTEKVAHVSIVREEKKALRVQMRCHLPEDEKRLFDFLHFLADLNKEKFRFTVLDQQRSLQEIKAGEGKIDPDHTYPQPDASGIFDRARARAMIRPFTHKKPRIKAELLMMELEAGFIAAWTFATDSHNLGEVLSSQSEVFASEAEANQAAGARMLEAVHELGDVDDKPTQKAFAAFYDWLFDLYPKLATAAGASPEVAS